MRILLLGKTGQLGMAILPFLEDLGETTAVDRSSCDLTSERSIRSLVRGVAPDVIVNTAAYTNVNGAESDRALAMQVNGDAPRILAEEARRGGGLLLHYSTDYVFDGTKQGAYVETDATGPLNVYGESKLAGERAIADVGGHYLVLRTSWVYGPVGGNFFRTIVRLAAEKDDLSVVSDQVGAPTATWQIARASDELIRQSLSGKPAATGIYHLTAGGQVSWHGFAARIVEQMGEASRLRAENIRPVTSAEYPTAACRPLNSVLCNDKLESAFGVRLAHWQDGLQGVFESLSRDKTREQ